MSTLIELEETEYTVVDNTFVEVTPSATEVCTVEEAPIIVEGRKVEYTVVGDALFASQDIGEAPQWLTSIIDQVIGSALDSSLTDLVQAREDMLLALTELGIANNNYAEIVNIDVTVDQAVTSRLAVINSNLAQANATIADLQTTRVTADQASAISLNVITSSLESTDVGTIGGSITTLAATVNTLTDSVSSTRTLVESRFGEVNGSVDVLAQSVSTLEQNLSNFTVTVNSNFQSVNTDISNINGEITGINDELSTVNSALAALNVQTEATANTVATMFEFNSVLQVGTNYYKSGFGLRSSVTTGGSGTLVDPYISEFWIDATKLKFTNSGVTGASSPFSIDASGATPVVSFNGVVNFSNLTDVPTIQKTYVQATAPTTGMTVGDTWIKNTDNTLYTYNGTDWVKSPTGVKTYLQSTAPTSGMTTGDIWVDSDDNYKQYRFNGSSWIPYAYDPVVAVNAGTTTISGGKITTGSITADKIDVTDLIVKKLQANTGPSPTGMVIDTVNGFIKVFDASGNLRVQIGNLTV